MPRLRRSSPTTRSSAVESSVSRNVVHTTTGRRSKSPASSTSSSRDASSAA